MKKSLASLLCFLVVWSTMPHAQTRPSFTGPWTTVVLSSSHSLSRSGAVLDDAVIQRTNASGVVVTITTHSDKRDNGQAYAVGALGTIKIDWNGTSKTLDFAVRAEGHRDGFTDQGKESHSIHLIKTMGGKMGQSDFVHEFDPADEYVDGLSIEQQQQLFEQKKSTCATCSAALPVQPSTLARVWSWFVPTVQAQIDPCNYSAICWIICGGDCLEVLFLGSFWIACMAICLANCYYIEQLWNGC